MKSILTTTNRDELETLAAKAYEGTREDDGIYRGFSAARIETGKGTIECRATPSQSRNSIKDWFSFRYYLNGKAVAKKNLPQ